MLLSLRPQIIHWNAVKKTGLIVISHHTCGTSSIVVAHSSDILCKQERRRLRHVSNLTSKIQATRHPESLPFSEIHHAIFGNSELQHTTQSLPHNETTYNTSDLLPLTQNIRSRELDKVRTGLLRKHPSYLDPCQKVHIGAIVKDLGFDGGPLKVKRHRLRIYNAAVIRTLNHGHRLTSYMAAQGLKYAQSARSLQGVALYVDRIKIGGLYLELSDVAWVVNAFYDRLARDPHPTIILRQLLDVVSIPTRTTSDKSPSGIFRLSKILGALRLRIQADSNCGLEGVWPIVSKLLEHELTVVPRNLATKSQEVWIAIIEDSLLVARHSVEKNSLQAAWLLFIASPLMVVQKGWRIMVPKLGSSRLLKDSKGQFAMGEPRFLPNASTKNMWLFGIEIPNRVISLLVQYFIDLGQPSEAWKVVQESKAEQDMLPNSTWSLLLDYPHYLPTLDTSMQPVILAKYEEMISKIEVAMGIVWHGGENGWHMPLQDQCDDGPYLDSFRTHDPHEERSEPNFHDFAQGHGDDVM